MEPKLSICIPTYNRPSQLENLLRSIEIAKENHSFPFEVCISDSSPDDRSQIIANSYANSFKIKFTKNRKAFGYAGNFRNCVNLATGEFVWLVGDDDLLLVKAFERIEKLFSDNPDVSFFCINANMLDFGYLASFPQPFSTMDLPKDMTVFSSSRFEGRLPFDELIDYKKFFDFLGGMYLSIFERSIWNDKQHVVSYKKLPLVKFEDLDDTFPHSKIFANAFMGKAAYFSNNPVVVTVSGNREWSEFYPLVRTFRLLDLLEEYRKNGLNKWLYSKNKNATYKYFFYDLLYYLRKKDSTWPTFSISKYIVNGLMCPNLYFSLLRFIVGKIVRAIKWPMRLFHSMM